MSAVKNLIAASIMSTLSVIPAAKASDPYAFVNSTFNMLDAQSAMSGADQCAEREVGKKIRALFEELTINPGDGLVMRSDQIGPILMACEVTYNKAADIYNQYANGLIAQVDSIENGMANVTLYNTTQSAQREIAVALVLA